jgi:hypothetical protein
MASLPVDLHSGTSMGCVHVLGALLSERNAHQRDLPIAPVEPPDITLSLFETGLGSISAATCPPTSCLSIAPLKMRVHAGRGATFVFAPRTGVSSADTAVLTALASNAIVEVAVEPAGMTSSAPLSGRKRTRKGAAASPALAQLLAVTYEPSVTHGGVLISATVPASTPEGSSVVIRFLSVAGCDVALGEAPVEVIVGFSHAPAAEGPVLAAAQAGDVPALMRLLDGGASTEEKRNLVRGLRLAQPELDRHVLAPTACDPPRVFHASLLRVPSAFARLPSLPCHPWHAPLPPPRTPALPPALPTLTFLPPACTTVVRPHASHDGSWQGAPGRCQGAAGLRRRHGG